MAVQVIVMNAPQAGEPSNTVAIVELQQGGSTITIAGLEAGEQRNFTVYPGTSIVVTEKEKT